MAPREQQRAISKILVNQQRNEPPCCHRLAHHLAITKSGQEPSVGSSSLLVIQVHGSKIATSEEKVADWKTLINQWRNEYSLRD